MRGMSLVCGLPPNEKAAIVGSWEWMNVQSNVRGGLPPKGKATVVGSWGGGEIARACKKWDSALRIAIVYRKYEKVD